MAVAPQVGLVGMRALRADIKKMGTAASPMKNVLVEAGRAAVDPVMSLTAGTLPQVETSQHSAGTMAGDLRPVALRTGAGVRMGRKSLPYAGPLEFGWPKRNRDYIPDGRYLFPAARELAQTSGALYAAALEHGFAAYPWTNEGTNPGGIRD